MPADTEKRVADFADLVATALANAATRAELIASRARIVTAADNARRGLERDLHDGAQQRLVSVGLQIQALADSIPTELDGFRARLSAITDGMTGLSNDLQRISRGIHPAILSTGGLGAALKTLARRSAVPANVDLHIEERLSAPAEIAAYYLVAEALTNVAKHAQASEVNMRVANENGILHVQIQDDGVGGANARKGSGLIGLKDRVEALGGRMEIMSAPGRGTSLFAMIPVAIESSGPPY
jgi:signal transduction histidine kinase